MVESLVEREDARVVEEGSDVGVLQDVEARELLRGQELDARADDDAELSQAAEDRVEQDRVLGRRATAQLPVSVTTSSSKDVVDDR
ncbi:MAG: hypothetical protein KF782_06350 [Labilithrix sp.]|nr:hypothetical protein [Labilithrix sp.]